RDRAGDRASRRRARVRHVEARWDAAQAARRLAPARARVAAQDRASRRDRVDLSVVHGASRTAARRSNRRGVNNEARSADKYERRKPGTMKPGLKTRPTHA